MSTPPKRSRTHSAASASAPPRDDAAIKRALTTTLGAGTSTRATRSAGREVSVSAFADAQSRRGKFSRGAHNLMAKLTPKLFGGMHTADRLEANRRASTTGRRGVAVVQSHTPEATKAEARARKGEMASTAVSALGSVPLPGASAASKLTSAAITAGVSREKTRAAKTAITEAASAPMVTGYAAAAHSESLTAEASIDKTKAAGGVAKAFLGELPGGTIAKAAVSGVEMAATRKAKAAKTEADAEASRSHAVMTSAQPMMTKPETATKSSDAVMGQLTAALSSRAKKGGP